MANPIILIHGYSDRGESFEPWKDLLRQVAERRGAPAAEVSISSYVTLSNEVTIKDIAEGFNRALMEQPGLEADEPFDAIVHSTGMLVIRAWLANYPTRIGRLKHLVAIAPATFGSPLAHKGRSWIGAIFKGNRDFGPDFMEAGDAVLDGLELGSKFTWDLAHIDLVGEDTFYGPTKKTPFAFVLCGNKPYGGLRRLVSEAGSDGTVRWAGCPLNTRKILLDLTRHEDNKPRIEIAPWRNMDIPLIFVDKLNHGTILSDPNEPLLQLIDDALQVSNEASFTTWIKNALAKSKPLQDDLDQFQQFIIHTVDERGDPINDFNVQLFVRDKSGQEKDVREFDLSVHTYSGDASYRCFHVNLTKLDSDKLLRRNRSLWMRVRASTGSKLVGYRGFVSDQEAEEVELELTELLGDAEVKLFFPFTTTLIELKLNREPLPPEGQNDVFWFLPRG